MMIKIAGLGWKEYWGSGWNKLDFSLVVLSVVDIAFSYLESSVLRIIKVLKAQKLLRLLRMTRMAKALKTMRSMLHLLVAIRDSMGAIMQVCYMHVDSADFLPFSDLTLVLNVRYVKIVVSYWSAHAVFSWFTLVATHKGNSRVG